MKPKHTPGPWTTYLDGKIWQVNSIEYGNVCILAHGHDPRKDKQANAHLIAAAPDLLHVCELILKEWERPTEGVQTGELIARLSQYSSEAREAIKKARGES